MRAWLPMREWLPMIGLFALAGCGYGWIRPDVGPVARLRLGLVTDLSPQGDLGIVVRQRLHRVFSSRARPRLDDRAPSRLVGVVRIGAEGPVGYAGQVAAMHEVEVVLELALLGPDEQALWRSGAVARRATYLRSATPLETSGGRRRALEQAAGRATEDACALLLAAGPLGVEPLGVKGEDR